MNPQIYGYLLLKNLFESSFHGTCRLEIVVPGHFSHTWPIALIGGPTQLKYLAQLLRLHAWNKTCIVTA